MSFVCTRQQQSESDREGNDTTCLEYNNNTHNFPVSVSIFGSVRSVYPKHNGENDNGEENSKNNEKKENKRKKKNDRNSREFETVSNS